MKAARTRTLVPLAVAAVAIVALRPALWPAVSSAPNYSPPPGEINLEVTQANIYQTICVRGWTKTVRPSASYTSGLKRQQIAERHLPGGPSQYQEDHLIPLELGGNPTDPRNLWPQPIVQAHIKDGLEMGLNHAVCTGRMTLDTARQKIRNPSEWSGAP